jgi:hypothetical protein
VRAARPKAAGNRIAVAATWDVPCRVCWRKLAWPVWKLAMYLAESIGLQLGWDCSRHDPVRRHV